MTKEELEKELKDKDSQLNNWYKEWQKQEKRIAELEKENAELKKLKRECETSLCRAEYQYNYEQLTKAKEIIKDLLGSENTSCEEEMFFEIRQKAEQFLSEVEK